MSFNAQQDTDTLAFVYPVGDDSEEAIRKSALYQDLATVQGIPYLQIRFLDLPSSTSHGIIFGSDPSSHVVLDDQDVSAPQFVITFNENRQVIIHDWGSKNGTQVLYNNQGRDAGARKCFQWIVGGHPALEYWKSIAVEVGTQFIFEIEVPYDTTKKRFRTQVDKFLAGSGEAEDLFANFHLGRALNTREHTAARTPTSEPIQLARPLGFGSYGKVFHSWDVSTGEEFAVKTPREGRTVEYSEWVKEAKIMENINHVCTPLTSIAIVTDYLPEKHCEISPSRNF